MTSNVSRTTDSGQVVIDGKRACIICARRPQRQVRGKWMSYCRECAAELERQRRGDRVWLLVTRAEAADVMKGRALGAWRSTVAGRHHASGLP